MEAFAQSFRKIQNENLLSLLQLTLNQPLFMKLSYLCMY
jgi:hypothetical protein